MAIVIDRKGNRFKIYNAKDRKTIVYTAEVFSDYKKEILKVSDPSGRVLSSMMIENFHMFLADWNRKYIIKCVDDPKVYEMRCIKYLKRHWSMGSDDPSEKYDFFGHNGRKKSIFENDKQIAMLTRSFLTAPTRKRFTSI